MMASFYDIIRYDIGPPALIAGTIVSAQYLVVLGGDDYAHWDLTGNTFSWAVVTGFLLYSALSLLVPSKLYYGPATSFGYIPEYKDNGILYYTVSLLGYIITLFFYPDISAGIYKNFSAILASCNWIAIVLCFYLLVKGKVAPSSSEKIEPKPRLYEFYRGMEVHPRILGMDVKQLVICRYGMMAWQLLIITFFHLSCMKHGFNFSSFVSLFLQTVYIGKFYWWETGYFNTLDIILDRAGYYLCWGCLVWVPSLYTFFSYFFVIHKPYVSFLFGLLCLVLGVIMIAFQYRVDWEKQCFRSCKGPCKLWGRPVTYIEASYKTKDGVRKNKLLTSGCWGFSRHLNYVLEIMLVFAWSLPGLGHGIWPFLYAFFIVILLIHRIFRDEEKCSKKYGADWDKYCHVVPYRLVPGIF